MLFIELGAAVTGLAVLSRLASRWGFSAIPLYLIGGLAFGKGGLLPFNFSENFIGVGAEIGIVLLLFMLGLEYTGEELMTSLRSGVPAGIVDLLLNFLPGLAAGLLFGWKPLAAVLLGGITYISSSGVAAKVLAELKWVNNPETPSVLSILVLEDLAMALYLPVISVLLIGQGVMTGVAPVLVALAAVGIVLFLALRYGKAINTLICCQSDEIILLTTFGLVLLVAGAAQRLQVSAAVGAFLVGIALSGPIAEQARRLIEPLRDLFAAMFFFFFGLQIDPARLPAVLPIAIVLGIATALTKIFTGWWAVRRSGGESEGGWRAGAVLVARGEFSIVIAGLGAEAGFDTRLEALSAAYVLFLAILGPVLARIIQPVRALLIKNEGFDKSIKRRA